MILSYVILTEKDVFFYVQEEAVSAEIRSELEKAGITIRPYYQVYEDVKKFAEENTVLLDEAVVNYTLFENIPSGVKTVNCINPSKPMKAMKNQVEQENVRKAHIKDAKAMCRFIYWLKQNVGKEEITEYSAAEKSYELRAQDPDFLDLSFGTICAYGPNAAMCHYAPTKDACAKVEPEGFFLIDSADSTGRGPQIYKDHCGWSADTGAEGAFHTGAQGKYPSCNCKIHVWNGRMPIWTVWQEALCGREVLTSTDGTGHGVGFLLNVHEGPQNINWNSAIRPGRLCTTGGGRPDFRRTGTVPGRQIRHPL